MSNRHVPTRTLGSILSELEDRGLVAEFAAIAKKHDVLLAEVMGHRRHGGVTEARQECWFVLRGRGWTFPRIGALFDRHNATVLHGVERHISKLATITMANIRRSAA